MDILGTAALKEPLIDTVEAEAICTSQSVICELDLVNMKPGEVEFSNQYSLKMKRRDTVHALVSWFDCDFSDLEKPVKLRTAPFSDYTHWKQTVFYLDHE